MFARQEFDMFSVKEIGATLKDKLLTPEQAAERLAIKPRTIREWLRNTDKGKPGLKGIKIGKLWRIQESDLEAFLQQ